MNIRDRILNFPAWKALILLVILFSFTLAEIEEIFLSRIFNFMDRAITGFERMAKEDREEIDRDYQNFDERQAYDHAQSAINAFSMESYKDTTKQDSICREYLIIKKLEKLYELPYVKKNGMTRSFIDKDIAFKKEKIELAISKAEFNVSQCEAVAE